MKKLMIVAMLMSLIPLVCSAGEKEIAERYLTKKEKELIMKMVTKGLKDPESARFKWVKANVLWGMDDSSYCGLVNAKNSYGAFIGYQTFYVEVAFVHGKMQQQADAIIGAEAQGMCQASLYSDLSSAE